MDTVFWGPGLTAMPADDWSEMQRELAASGVWIMDGDLGPYDALAPRIGRADTVVLLDFSLLRCAWRVVRRSRERAGFWWWLLTWRHRSRPTVLDAVARYAPSADVHILHTPRELRHFLTTVEEGRA